MRVTCSVKLFSMVGANGREEDSQTALQSVKRVWSWRYTFSSMPMVTTREQSTHKLHSEAHFVWVKGCSHTSLHCVKSEHASLALIDSAFALRSFLSQYISPKSERIMCLFEFKSRRITRSFSPLHPTFSFAWKKAVLNYKAFFKENSNSGFPISLKIAELDMF